MGCTGSPDERGTRNPGYKPTDTVITIPTGYAGRYMIGFQVAWTANASGIRDASVIINRGDPDFANLATELENDPDGTYVTYQGRAVQVELSEGDEIELRVYQTSGSDVILQANNPNNRPYLWISKVR